MVYVDSNIIRAPINKEDCISNLGFDVCNHIDQGKDSDGLNLFRNGSDFVVSRNALLRDLPRKPNEFLGSILTQVELGKLKIKDISSSNARAEGIKIMNDVCSSMDAGKLTNIENVFYHNFCVPKWGRLKDTFILEKEKQGNILKDVDHLGSAVLLGEKKLLSRDNHFGAIKRFVKEIDIVTL